jgi:hypothetical protein
MVHGVGVHPFQNPNGTVAGDCGQPLGNRGPWWFGRRGLVGGGFGLAHGMASKTVLD